MTTLEWCSYCQSLGKKIGFFTIGNPLHTILKSISGMDVVDIDYDFFMIKFDL